MQNEEIFIERKENPVFKLEETIPPVDDRKKLKWVSENTAILVVHGIGNQLPFETIDSFGKGLIDGYCKGCEHTDIVIEHLLVPKSAGQGKDKWFDNVIRLRKEGKDEPYIDLYEYYWANYTQDKTDAGDISKWIDGVAAGAGSFYSMKKNAALGKKYQAGASEFFDSKGNLRKGRYKRFLFALRYLIPAVQAVVGFVLNFINGIPVIGRFVSETLRRFNQNTVYKFNNVVGDIVVYNITDPKNKYYCVKREIMDGAVKALKFLIEREKDNEDQPANENEAGELFYPSVLVAGHSLGTQVSYDAINKINLMINENELKNYGPDGYLRKNPSIPAGAAKDQTHISNQLRGFITFGSPLDKIAFFLRETVDDTMYIRQQVLDHYHGFKQNDWSLTSPPANYHLVNCSLQRFLEDIPWRNYFDYYDPVSGSLDFYKNLENIDCVFVKGKTNSIRKRVMNFTHSNYWECPEFYIDIIHKFLQ